MFCYYGPFMSKPLVHHFLRCKRQHTRLRVRGWGSPNSDDWRKSVAICLLCGSTVHFSDLCSYKLREVTKGAWLMCFLQKILLHTVLPPLLPPTIQVSIDLCKVLDPYDTYIFITMRSVTQHRLSRDVRGSRFQ
jgi:hypothetical protein